MRILMINSQATCGSTGGITTLLSEKFLESGHEVLVGYGYNEGKPLPSRYIKLTFRGEIFLASKIGKIIGNHGFFCLFSTNKLKRIIKIYRPDIVQLFNLHASYINDLKLLEYLKAKKINTVYTMFDEYAYMGKCCFSYECNKFTSHCHDCTHLKDYPRSSIFDRSSYYFEKKKNIYDQSSNLTFVGGIYVYYRSKVSALLKNKKVELIEEPIDYDNIYYPRNTDELRRILNIPSENIIILTITNFGDDRKGGRFFFDLHEQMKGLSGYSYVFVGYDDNIFGKKEGVITIPYVKDKDELAEYYSLADVFVFTSLADTSPNTVQQALGCGSPVCAFNIEGISTMGISENEVLNLSETKDVECLKNNVLKYRKKDADTITKCRESVYKKYNITSIYKKYLELYRNIISG